MLHSQCAAVTRMASVPPVPGRSCTDRRSGCCSTPACQCSCSRSDSIDSCAVAACGASVAALVSVWPSRGRRTSSRPRSSAVSKEAPPSHSLSSTFSRACAVCTFSTSPGLTMLPPACPAPSFSRAFRHPRPLVSAPTPTLSSVRSGTAAAEASGTPSAAAAVEAAATLLAAAAGVATSGAPGTGNSTAMPGRAVSGGESSTRTPSTLVSSLVPGRQSSGITASRVRAAAAAAAPSPSRAASSSPSTCSSASSAPRSELPRSNDARCSRSRVAACSASAASTTPSGLRGREEGAGVASCVSRGLGATRIFDGGGPGVRSAGAARAPSAQGQSAGRRAAGCAR